MVRVEALTSEVSTWGRAQGGADARLRPLLARDYVGFAQTAPAFGSWLMPPTPTVTIILNIGEPFAGLPEAFVAGMAETATLLQRQTGAAGIDLKLTPLGAFTLCGGLPLHELTGRVVDVRQVLGPAAGELVEALREAAGWRRRFQLVERFLLRRMAAGPPPSPAVAAVWQQLQQTAGSTRIAGLADERGWSRKHLVAMCREQLGLPPKTLAKLLRFNALLQQLDPGQAYCWPELALAHGYYDQSHLVRDFRQFTGMTPTDFAARHLGGYLIIGE